MARRQAVNVRVVNRLVRYTASKSIDGDEVVSQLGAKKSGKSVILALKSPRATLLIDEEGRLVVHGTSHPEVSRAAAKELLLRLGQSDSGLTTERGPLVVSFDYGQPLRTDRIQEFVPEAKVDERLECVRIVDEHHDMELLFFSNGGGVALGARSENMVSLAASHWGTRFDAERLFVEVLVRNVEDPEEEGDDEAQGEPLDLEDS
jgi:TATA-box binding protein (TBP) (component of TFIID and TFIIIB)